MASFWTTPKEDTFYFTLLLDLFSDLLFKFTLQLHKTFVTNRTLVVDRSAKADLYSAFTQEVHNGRTNGSNRVA